MLVAFITSVALDPIEQVCLEWDSATAVCYLININNQLKLNDISSCVMQ